MPPSLDEWRAAGALIARVYREELGRDGEPDGWFNWAFHWREGNHGAGFEDWLRARFRESPEGRQHTHEAPPDVPPVQTPAVPSPLPTGPAAPGPLPTPGRVLRVTDPSDGELVPRMYSYWPNAWIRDAGTVYVFAGHDDGSPRFFRVDLTSGHVQRLGSLIPYRGTTEGWYWDLEGWIYLLDGSAMRRVNPFSGDDRIVFDIQSAFPDCILWQAHSSDDGQTHSATVKRVVSDGAYPAIGTVVYRRGRQEFFPAQGDLDESQITPDGQFLVIKESEKNRIINLDSRETRIIEDADGAVGHSDCGPGILVGEDNIHGACVLWDLRGRLVPERRLELFKTWNMGYVSIRGGRCLNSGETHLSLVALDGSGLTPLLEHGINTNDYDKRIKANLDPSGRVACYMANGTVFLLLL